MSARNRSRAEDAVSFSLPWFFLALIVIAVPAWNAPGAVFRSIVLAFVPAAMLVDLAFSRTRWRASSPLSVMLLAFGVVLIAHVALDTTDARFLLRDGWTTISLACLALWGSCVCRKDITNVAFAMAVGVLFVSVLGLSEAWLGLDFVMSIRPPAATFGNRNVAAQFLVGALPLLLMHSKTDRAGSLWRSRLCFAAAVGGSMFLVATRARSAIAAAAFGLLLLTLLACRGEDGSFKLPVPLRGVRLWIGVALIGIAALIPVSGRESLPGIVRSFEMLAEDPDGSADVRFALRNNTTAMALARPLLGHGPGRFEIDYPLFHDARTSTPGFGLQKRPRHVHNDALQFAAEWGIVVALLFFGVIAWAAVRGVNQSLRRCDSIDSWAVASLLAICAHSLFSFPLHSPASAAIAFLALGRLAHGAALPRTGVRREWHLLAIAVLGAVAVTFAIGDSRSQGSVSNAVRARDDGNFAAAAEHARQVPSWTFRREDRGLAARILFESDSDARSTVNVLRRAVVSDPHNLNLLLSLGPRQIKTDQLDEARATFEHAISISPDLARAWLGLAMVHERNGDDAALRDACSRALSLEPDLEPAREFCAGR